MTTLRNTTRLGALLAAALLAGCRTTPPVHTADVVVTSVSDCELPSVPDPAGLRANSKLPDPFVFADGSRVTSAAEWRCRRGELANAVQRYELGAKPAPEPVTARMQGQDLLLTLTHAGKTVELPVKIQLPPTGRAPYPALIGMGAISLDNDELSKMGVALVTFPNGAFAEQKNGASRGKGGFYDLYGSDHPAGAMSAWAWGVSELIDALAHTPSAQIDANRLGVTGCSRNGKGTIVAAALDERLRLAIAQESGAGGSASWRVSEAQLAAGQNVQTLHQIVTENVWFTDAFKQFGARVDTLPYDQHEVMGLIAPRGLLLLENTSMEWLGNQSAWVDGLAAHAIWQALGAPDAMGITQVGGHPHCRLPESQYGTVNAYVRRFLLDDAKAETRVQETDGTFERDLKRWVDWDTPALR